MTALILVIWLLCGIGGAMIAQSKNRSPWIGAVVGFAGGLIGVFVLALLSKTSDEAVAPALPPAPDPQAPQLHDGYWWSQSVDGRWMYFDDDGKRWLSFEEKQPEQLEVLA